MPSKRKVELAVLALCLNKLNVKKKKKRRAEWVKEWLLDRDKHTHINLLSELRTYPSDFHNYMRMDDETYHTLLEMVTPLIEKQDTKMRRSINPHERLIRYLATGRTYEDLKFTTCISPQALSKIIPETCRAIYQVLAPQYLKFPTTEAEWKEIAKNFEERWQFPNCLGAVDGKHVAISPPPNSGSYFYNYKGFHSLVLMAIANANYELIYVHFGTNGRVSDGGVLGCTEFYSKLKQGTLNLPQISDNGLPYAFISDEAFALREDFLKPFNVRVLNDHRRIFNYRLSRARRVVENVFGILVSRFAVLKSRICLQLDNIDAVVMACCVLHNFLRTNVSHQYTPPGSFDMEDPDTHEIQNGVRAGESNIAPLASGQTRNSSEGAKRVRDLFVDYFNNEGSVAWQNRLAGLSDSEH
ncbi:hypothetical protein RRG08_029029 [Elysia crispata]|uniref:DDE Tnp4 domain-containing protein n=1 Tax=Elysia crispata TaxID=231223 RepID=A0AAE1E0D6_9GAST|nr:hypothetical protein RRG08_029029 [Elysia crispata]